MSLKVYSLTLVLACASSVLASAQASSSPTEGSSGAPSSPIAYIYVSNAVNSNTNQIHGYAAASNGTLTPITGSPFPYSVNYLAVNGAWLFGVEYGGQNNQS